MGASHSQAHVTNQLDDKLKRHIRGEGGYEVSSNAMGKWEVVASNPEALDRMPFTGAPMMDDDLPVGEDMDETDTAQTVVVVKKEDVVSMAGDGEEEATEAEDEKTEPQTQTATAVAPATAVAASAASSSSAATAATATAAAAAADDDQEDSEQQPKTQREADLKLYESVTLRGVISKMIWEIEDAVESSALGADPITAVAMIILNHKFKSAATKLQFDETVADTMKIPTHSPSADSKYNELEFAKSIARKFEAAGYLKRRNTAAAATEAEIPEDELQKQRDARYAIMMSMLGGATIDNKTISLRLGTYPIMVLDVLSDTTWKSLDRCATKMMISNSGSATEVDYRYGGAKTVQQEPLDTLLEALSFSDLFDSTPHMDKESIPSAYSHADNAMVDHQNFANVKMVSPDTKQPMSIFDVIPLSSDPDLPRRSERFLLLVHQPFWSLVRRYTPNPPPLTRKKVKGSSAGSVIKEEYDPATVLRYHAIWQETTTFPLVPGRIYVIRGAPTYQFHLKYEAKLPLAGIDTEVERAKYAAVMPAKNREAERMLHHEAARRAIEGKTDELKLLAPKGTGAMPWAMIFFMKSNAAIQPPSSSATSPVASAPGKEIKPSETTAAAAAAAAKSPVPAAAKWLVPRSGPYDYVGNAEISDRLSNRVDVFKGTTQPDFMTYFAAFHTHLAEYLDPKKGIGHRETLTGESGSEPEPNAYSSSTLLAVMKWCFVNVPIFSTRNQSASESAVITIHAASEREALEDKYLNGSEWSEPMSVVWDTISLTASNLYKSFKEVSVDPFALPVLPSVHASIFSHIIVKAQSGKKKEMNGVRVIIDRLSHRLSQFKELYVKNAHGPMHYTDAKSTNDFSAQMMQDLKALYDVSPSSSQAPRSMLATMPARKRTPGQMDPTAENEDTDDAARLFSSDLRVLEDSKKEETEFRRLKLLELLLFESPLAKSWDQCQYKVQNSKGADKPYVRLSRDHMNFLRASYDPALRYTCLARVPSRVLHSQPYTLSTAYIIQCYSAAFVEMALWLIGTVPTKPRTERKKASATAGEKEKENEEQKAKTLTAQEIGDYRRQVLSEFIKLLPMQLLLENYNWNDHHYFSAVHSACSEDQRTSLSKLQTATQSAAASAASSSSSANTNAQTERSIVQQYLVHLAYCDRLPDLSTAEGSKATAAVLSEYPSYKIQSEWIAEDIKMARYKQVQSSHLRSVIAVTISQIAELLQTHITGRVSVADYVRPAKEVRKEAAKSKRKVDEMKQKTSKPKEKDEKLTTPASAASAAAAPASSSSAAAAASAAQPLPTPVPGAGRGKVKAKRAIAQPSQQQDARSVVNVGTQRAGQSAAAASSQANFGDEGGSFAMSIGEAKAKPEPMSDAGERFAASASGGGATEGEKENDDDGDATADDSDDGGETESEDENEQNKKRRTKAKHGKRYASDEDKDADMSESDEHVSNKNSVDDRALYGDDGEKDVRRSTKKRSDSDAEDDEIDVGKLSLQEREYEYPMSEADYQQTMAGFMKVHSLTDADVRASQKISSLFTGPRRSGEPLESDVRKRIRPNEFEESDSSSNAPASSSSAASVAAPPHSASAAAAAAAAVPSVYAAAQPTAVPPQQNWFRMRFIFHCANILTLDPKGTDESLPPCQPGNVNQYDDIYHRLRNGRPNNTFLGLMHNLWKTYDLPKETKVHKGTGLYIWSGSKLGVYYHGNIAPGVDWSSGKRNWHPNNNGDGDLYIRSMILIVANDEKTSRDIEAYLKPFDPTIYRLKANDTPTDKKKFDAGVDEFKNEVNRVLKTRDKDEKQPQQRSATVLADTAFAASVASSSSAAAMPPPPPRADSSKPMQLDTNRSAPPPPTPGSSMDSKHNKPTSNAASSSAASSSSAAAAAAAAPFSEPRRPKPAAAIAEPVIIEIPKTEAFMLREEFSYEDWTILQSVDFPDSGDRYSMKAAVQNRDRDALLQAMAALQYQQDEEAKRIRNKTLKPVVAASDLTVVRRPGTQFGTSASSAAAAAAAPPPPTSPPRISAAAAPEPSISIAPATPARASTSAAAVASSAPAPAPAAASSPARSIKEEGKSVPKPKSAAPPHQQPIRMTVEQAEDLTGDDDFTGGRHRKRCMPASRHAIGQTTA